MVSAVVLVELVEDVDSRPGTDSTMVIVEASSCAAETSFASPVAGPAGVVVATGGAELDVDPGATSAVATRVLESGNHGACTIPRPWATDPVPKTTEPPMRVLTMMLPHQTSMSSNIEGSRPRCGRFRQELTHSLSRFVFRPRESPNRTATVWETGPKTAELRGTGGVPLSPGRGVHDDRDDARSGGRCDFHRSGGRGSATGEQLFRLGPFRNGTLVVGPLGQVIGPLGQVIGPSGRPKRLRVSRSTNPCVPANSRRGAVRGVRRRPSTR